MLIFFNGFVYIRQACCRTTVNNDAPLNGLLASLFANNVISILKAISFNLTLKCITVKTSYLWEICSLKYDVNTEP